MYDIFRRQNTSRTYQIDTVKYLDFSNLVAAWVGEIAVIIVDGQCTQPCGVRGCVPDGVKYFHVTDVVYV